MSEKTRRQFVKDAAIVGGSLAAAPLLGVIQSKGGIAIAAETASDQLMLNKYFKVEIKGLYSQVPGVSAARVAGSGSAPAPSVLLWFQWRPRR